MTGFSNFYYRSFAFPDQAFQAGFMQTCDFHKWETDPAEN